MKNGLLLSSFGAATVLAATYASSFASANGFIDEARVISAQPVYQTVRVNHPQEQCWNEKVSSEGAGYRSHTSTILGTIIGAAIGNKFSEGRGRDVATVAGAVLGGSVGRDVSAGKRHQPSRDHYERRCETVDNFHSEQHVSGYDVKYRYKGNTYHTHTSQHPGDRITVSVNVSPIE